MNQKFIEVHMDDMPVSFNVKHIVGYVEHGLIMVYDEPGKATTIDESYGEIRKLIQDAGCAISRKDPRIDPAALTLEDFREMIGQPVWSVYHQQWFFAAEYTTCDHQIINVVLHDINGETMTVEAEDLIHQPMYRMKVLYEQSEQSSVCD